MKKLFRFLPLLLALVMIVLLLVTRVTPNTSGSSTMIFSLFFIGVCVMLVLQAIVLILSRRRKKRAPDSTPPEEEPCSKGPRCPVARAACGLLSFLSCTGAAVCLFLFFIGAFRSDPAGLLLTVVMCAVLMTFAVTTLAGIRRGEVSRGRNAGVISLDVILLVFLSLLAYSVFA